MFIIVGAYRNTDESLPLEERIAKAMGRCGASVLFTSVTDTVAFLLGANSSLPAVSYFCIYAGVSVLFDFGLQVTLFVALLVLDERRLAAKRCECACCCLPEVAEVGDKANDAPVASSGVVLEQTDASSAQRGLNDWLADRYVPQLTSKAGIAVTLVVFTAFTGMNVYGISQLTENFDPVDLVPDESYARIFINKARSFELMEWDYYMTAGMYYEDVDYHKPEVQDAIVALETDALANKHTDDAFIFSWMAAFRSWANDSEYDNAAIFSAAVQDFLEDGANAAYRDHILFKTDGTIMMSRSILYHIDVAETDGKIAAMHEMTKTTDHADHCIKPAPWGFSFPYIFIYQFTIIYGETLMNMLMCLVGVGFVAAFMLVSPTATVLTVSVIVIIDVDLLGLIYFWGLDLNSISMIDMVMAIGLVVDYVAHIVHYFLIQVPEGFGPEQPNTFEYRVAKIRMAFREVGPSVVMGIFTTFVAILPLSMANAQIFRVFFKMFFNIVVLGGAHGLVLMPVLLAVLPVASPPHHTVSSTSSGDATKQLALTEKPAAEVEITNQPSSSEA